VFLRGDQETVGKVFWAQYATILQDLLKITIIGKWASQLRNCKIYGVCRDRISYWYFPIISPTDLDVPEIDADGRSVLVEDPESSDGKRKSLFVVSSNCTPVIQNTTLSPLFRPTTSPKQTRSQSEPESIPLRPYPSPPLRRHHTTGISTRIEALQRAYTAVVNDESQVPVEDLVQATALVNRIETKLNEQMGKRLGRNAIPGPDES
jgi:hypothetical protein